jgi:predicted negative regulator of RcsB-dependent stress response
MDLILVFAGAIVSVLIEVLKNFMKLNRLGALVSVVVLSLLGGFGFWYLRETGLWESFLQIMASAALVYAFIVKNVQTARGIE